MEPERENKREPTPDEPDEKFYKVVDNVGSLVSFYILSLISLYNSFPFFTVMPFPDLNLLKFIILIGPIIFITCLEIGLFLYNRNRDEEKGNKMISLFTYYSIPLIFILYIPLNMIELIMWIVPLFGLYIGFWKERFPLIRYSIDLYKVERYRDKATKKSKMNAFTSQYSLIFCLLMFLIMAASKIYPIPFLFLFYLKYYFRRKFFDNKEEIPFAKKMDEFGKWVLKILDVFGIISAIIIGILIPI